MANKNDLLDQDISKRVAEVRYHKPKKEKQRQSFFYLLLIVIITAGVLYSLLRSLS